MNDPHLAGLIMNAKQIGPSHVFKDHQYGVSDLCQNKLKPHELATVSYDTTIKIYDVDKLIITKTLYEHTKGVWSLDYSNNSSQMLTGGNDNKVILWDTNTYKPITELNVHMETVYDVKFSMNGKYFASCSKGMICIWDVNNLKEPMNIVKDLQNDFVYSVNFTDNDKYLISGFIDGYMLLVDIHNTNSFKKLLVPKLSKTIFSKEEELIEGNSINHISKFKNKLNIQDDEVLTSHDDGLVYIWKIQEGELKEKSKFFYSNSSVTSINSSFDNKRLIASCKDHSSVIWDVNQDSIMSYILVGHSDVVTCADFITNDIVVSCSYDTSLRFWKLD